MVDERSALLEALAFQRGFPVLIYGAAPAAGAPFSLGEGFRPEWELVAVTFTLVTDGNAANRFVSVDYDDGNGIKFGRNVFSQAVTATTTAHFSFDATRGSSDWNANNDASLPLMPTYFSPGQSVQINIANEQAGDQLSAIVLKFQRYFSNYEDLPERLRQTLLGG